MKKIFLTLLTIALSVLMVLSVASCGKENEKITYNPQLPPAPIDDYTQYLGHTFNSSEDLSDCQGYKNWYYYCGDPEDRSLALMTFNDYYGRWCSKYQQLYYFTYLWGEDWYPEDQQGYGIGMGFKFPATGKIVFSAKIRLLQDPSYNNGDGVVFTISDKNGDPYDGKSITPAEGGQDFVLSQTIDVKMGEEILFMLFPNGGNTHDYTKVIITINYVAD